MNDIDKDRSSNPKPDIPDKARLELDKIVQRLSEADFSQESSIRESLRQRLEQRIAGLESASRQGRPGLWISGMQASTYLKTGLVVLAILAQVIINPSPEPANSQILQHEPPAITIVVNTSPTVSVDTTSQAAYQPIPIPTPGFALGFSTIHNQFKPLPVTAGLPATSIQTGAETPKPTPLAPIATLP